MCKFNKQWLKSQTNCFLLLLVVIINQVNLIRLYLYSEETDIRVLALRQLSTDMLNIIL